MPAAALNAYVGATVERWRQIGGPRQREIERPGLRGFVSCDPRADVRLLVTDDGAEQSLIGVLAQTRGGTITVLSRAARCADLLRRDARWSSGTLTAMVCPDLAPVPRLSLDRGLQLRPIRRVDSDPADGVELRAAVDAVLLADPGEDPDTFMSFLRSLPGRVALFAAVGRDEKVRATSGWQLQGTHARVILVDTDPTWRGRGIATAMTSLALHAARTEGARMATLDATPAARGLYLRLGFAPVSEIIRFRRVA